jgi:hypothetical protein
MSVNSRVDTDKLMPCYFGKALKHLINWAVAARKLHPRKRILATNLDIKAAFQQCHLNFSMVVQNLHPTPIQATCPDDAQSLLAKLSAPKIRDQSQNQSAT